MTRLYLKSFIISLNVKVLEIVCISYRKRNCIIPQSLTNDCVLCIVYQAEQISMGQKKSDLRVILCTIKSKI